MPKSVVFNIEANGLNPDKIWVISCQDIDTGEVHVFRRPDLCPEPFTSFWNGISCGIGHNVIGYDLPPLKRLVAGFSYPDTVIDTLVISRLLDYSRTGGHSLSAWAAALKLPKTVQPPWMEFSEDLVEYCQENVSVNVALYKAMQPYLDSPRWKRPIQTELTVAQYLKEMKENGFYLDIDNVRKLRYNILEELSTLDATIKEAFPCKVRAVKEITPRRTKFGTLNRNDFRWAGNDLSEFNGGPFTLIEYEDFNPGSPSQIVERLNEAGWKPTEKTKGHQQAIRDKDKEKIARFKKTGWMVSETNLATLPDTAPTPARSLALRITLASRSRTLTEWIDAFNPATHAVHCTVNVLGAWTHRCSHTKPNLGNVPTPQPLNPKSTFLQRRANEIDSQLRTYWSAAPETALIGVDAEGIQLRVLAHYIDDPRFTKAVTEGKKEDGTDPHSLNKLALGSPCKSREDAKTFIYAWLLGAGVVKVSQILGCSIEEAQQACDDFVRYYPGLQLLKENEIPADAIRKYFIGFDGRYVSIPGDTQSAREHFALAGYLQNGEVVIMKRAMEIWVPRLRAERIPFRLRNFVHDEWQTEGEKSVAEYIATVQKNAIREAGVELNLRCPMSGSSDIGFTWKDTH